MTDAEVLRKEDVCGDEGLIKEVLREGTGDEFPPTGSRVSVHYVGKLLDGSVFDSSRDRGQEFEFRIGKGSVIKGWDKGVATMKIGELAILTCRADYAYGEAGSPPKIPGGATLKFEVELFGWDDEKDEWEMTADEKLAAVGKRKAEGNEAFKAANYGNAKQKYNKGLQLLSSDYDFDDAQKKESAAFKVSLNLNLAQCHLNDGAAKDAVAAATKALEIEPDNAKGLFRRAKANLALGEYAAARDDLTAAQKVQDTPDIRKALANVDAQEKRAVKKQKALYKNMFGK